MKLLVVEDSAVLGTALERGLTAAGFAVDIAKSGEDAMLFLGTSEYEAVVLDWMLPGMSGLEVLARIRKEGQKAIPVLLLSARSEVQDRIHGLDVGADDYLAKPFDFGELVARLRALVRRGPATRAPQIEIAGIVVDTSARAVSVNGQVVELTRSEYLVLEALFMHRGVVLTKDKLLDRLHDSDSFASRNVIEVFVSGLRKKLRSAGAPDIIATRRGHGYLVPAVGSDSCPDDEV